MRVNSQLILIVCVCLLTAGCAVIVNAPDVDPEASPAPPPSPGGYSGMAWMGGDSYLVVHDTKIHRDKPRIGVLEVGGEEGARYRVVEVTDWRHDDGRSSDLESVCALPDSDDEFLAAESGTWEGDFGRVFHFRLTQGGGEIVHAERLPNLADNGPDTWGDNFEGIACASRADGTVLVILGERGGTPFNPDGSLRWATYDPTRQVFDWSDEGLAGVIVAAPGAWVAPEAKRDVADLYLDANGVLWSVASEDAGDDGPFRSGIWAVGRVDPDAAQPISLFVDPPIGWWLDGLKVESLAAPPAHLPFAEASVGTEDENLGGVWRPLYPTAAQLPPIVDGG